MDGEVNTIIKSSYPAPGMYEIAASVHNEQVKLAVDAIQVQIVGVTLTVDPPGLTNAKREKPYTFNFIADKIPASVSNVKFTWSFGVGQSGAGNSNGILVNRSSKYKCKPNLH